MCRLRTKFVLTVGLQRGVVIGVQSLNGQISVLGATVRASLGSLPLKDSGSIAYDPLMAPNIANADTGETGSVAAVAAERIANELSNVP